MQVIEWCTGPVCGVAHGDEGSLWAPKPDRMCDRPAPTHTARPVEPCCQAPPLSFGLRALSRRRALQRHSPESVSAQVLLPESFRGGCSFGAGHQISRPASPCANEEMRALIPSVCKLGRNGTIQTSTDAGLMIQPSLMLLSKRTQLSRAMTIRCIRRLLGTRPKSTLLTAWPVSDSSRCQSMTCAITSCAGNLSKSCHAVVQLPCHCASYTRSAAMSLAG